MPVSRAWARVLTICTLLLGTCFSVGAHAQVIVLQSTVKNYKPGLKIGSSSTVNVPEGQMLLVMLPSGVTRKIEGPFSDSARRLAKSGGRSNAALFKAVANYVKTAGTTASSVGAVRSVAPSGGVNKKLNIPFSWSTLHVRAAGDICLDQNSPVNIVRSDAKRPKLFNIIDLSAAKKAQIVFPAGMNALPWPAELDLSSGNYGILTKGRKVYQVRLRIIKQIPAPENTLQVLHGQRCTQQLKAYLRDLATQNIAQVTE